MKIAVIGAGISGLATAFILSRRQPDWEIVIFESSGRCGGKAWTDTSQNGYRCEWGVNGFLDNKPRTLELCQHLGLSPVRASTAASLRYIFRNGRMNVLPDSPAAFLGSPLLSLRGRLRIMAEAIIPRGDKTDESLREFATRRLGKEGFEALIDPMASGVFAGDPARMSLVSCFPRIHELEMQYGSLIRAMIRLQIKARKEGRKSMPGAGPGGTLTSFAGGISELIERLEVMLAGRIRKNTPVNAVTQGAGIYQLHLADGANEDFDKVIVAAPAWAQASMLATLSPAVSKLLNSIDYPPLSVVCLGYRDADVAGSVNGFGFLVPGAEKRNILGAVIDSNVFGGRAPPGNALLRVMTGGARAPGLAMLEERKLTDLVRAELRSMTGITAEPEFCQIYFHKRAIPQYHVGHARLLEQLQVEMKQFPGLYLAGNAFRGVSLNDCVYNAFRIAGSVAKTRKLRGGRAGSEPV